MGGPGREPDEIEGRAQAAVRIGEAVRVNLGAARQDVPTQRLSAARMQRVRGAHCAQVGKKREHVWITDNRTVQIDDRQRQARALGQAAERPHVDEGGDAGRRAAENLALGDGQALAQFGQGLAPDQRRDQKAVALQRAPHLHQRAGQIVHRLQRKQRNGEIEAAIRGGQTLEVANRGQKIAISEARLGRGDPDDAIDLSAGRKRGRAVRAGRAEVGGKGEASLDERQPIAKVLGRPFEQEVGLGLIAGRAPKRGRDAD